jgi:hypothetical protein
LEELDANCAKAAGLLAEVKGKLLELDRHQAELLTVAIGVQEYHTKLAATDDSAAILLGCISRHTRDEVGVDWSLCCVPRLLMCALFPQDQDGTQQQLNVVLEDSESDHSDHDDQD